MNGFRVYIAVNTNNEQSLRLAYYLSLLYSYKEVFFRTVLGANRAGMIT